METVQKRKADTSRLDAFVDAAFAFAVTLLVIGGGQAPTGWPDLIQALARTPAFAVSFLLIARFWLGHRAYTGLVAERSGWSTGLSLAIVFVILVFVYPLRLLTDAGAHYLSGGRLPGGELVQTFEDLARLYAIYGLGFAVLSLLYAALYAEALFAKSPAPTTAQRRELIDWAGSWGICAAAGLLSAALAWFGPLRQAPWLPGVTYFAIPVGIGLWAFIDSRRKPPGKPAAPTPKRRSPGRRKRP
jgi:uncharacterized membrane protein